MAVSAVDLNSHQLLTLGMLAKRHDGESGVITQDVHTKIVTVEFKFPVAYVIAANGRAIEC